MSLSSSLPPATGTDSCLLTKRWSSLLVPGSGVPARGREPPRGGRCSAPGAGVRPRGSPRAAGALAKEEPRRSRGRLSASASGAELEYLGKRSTFGFGKDIRTFIRMRFFVSVAGTVCFSLER